MNLTTVLHEYITKIRGPELRLYVPLHDDNRDMRKFRVSDAGRCQVMRYWKREGKTPAPIPASTRLLFEAGNLLHAWLNHVLYEMNMLYKEEVEVEDEHRIGHLDALAKEDDGPLTLYDFKTVNSKKFYYIQQHKAADAHHAHQVITYAMMYPEPIDLLRVAYINRENLEILETHVHFDAYAERVADDWCTLIDAWNSKQEPTATADVWECKYCGYRDECPHIRR